MNKGLLIGAAIVAVAAVGGWSAMSMLSQDTDVPAAMLDSSATATGETTAAALAPPGAYAGTVTESGGFTGDVLEGDADAPVTIIEYASLTCPHCASFHDRIYKQLKTDYIDTGKVKFIYRDFPLNNPAIAASIIARCGGKDRYTAFIDLFLTQQDRWTRAEDWMGELQKMARFGGLGADQINACLADQALGQSVVNRTRAASEVFRVNSTPTIIVNGKVFEGSRDFGSMSKAIDAML
jgi:protein-disulfide isomerase